MAGTAHEVQTIRRLTKAICVLFGLGYGAGYGRDV